MADNSSINWDEIRDWAMGRWDEGKRLQPSIDYDAPIGPAPASPESQSGGDWYNNAIPDYQQGNYQNELARQYRPIPGPYQDFVAGKISQALSGGASLDDPLDLTDIHRANQRVPKQYRPYLQSNTQWLGNLGTVREAQAALVHSTAPMLLGHALSMEKRHGVGMDDVIQQSALGVMESIRSYDPREGNFRTHAAYGLGAQTGTQSTAVAVKELKYNPNNITGVQWNEEANQHMFRIQGVEGQIMQDDMFTSRLMTSTEKLMAHTDMRHLAMPSSRYQPHVRTPVPGAQIINGVEASVPTAGRFTAGIGTSTDDWLETQSLGMARKQGIHVDYQGFEFDHGDSFQDGGPSGQPNRPGHQAWRGDVQRARQRFEERSRANKSLRWMIRRGQQLAAMDLGAGIGMAEGGRPMQAMESLHTFGMENYVDLEKSTFGIAKRLLGSSQTLSFNPAPPQSPLPPMPPSIDGAPSREELAMRPEEERIRRAKPMRSNAEQPVSKRTMTPEQRAVMEAAYAEVSRDWDPSYQQQSAESTPEASRNRPVAQASGGGQQPPSEPPKNASPAADAIPPEQPYEVGSGAEPTPAQIAERESFLNLPSEAELSGQSGGRKIYDPVSRSYVPQEVVDRFQRDRAALDNLNLESISPVNYDPQGAAHPGSSPDDLANTAREVVDRGRIERNRGVSARAREEHRRRTEQPRLSFRGDVGQAIMNFGTQEMERQSSGRMIYRERDLAPGEAPVPAEDRISLFDRDTGEMIANNQNIRQGIQMGREAVAGAMTSGPLPADSRDANATLRHRASKILYKILDKAFDDMKGPATEKAKQTMKDIAFKGMEGMLQDSGNQTIGSTTSKDVYQMLRGNTVDLTRMNRGEAKAYIDANPNLAKSVAREGGFKQLWGASKPVVLGDYEGTEGGISIGGGDNSLGGRIGGLFGGNYGQLMYGMYIGQRLWQKTGAGVMQGIPKYQDSMSQYGALYRSAYGGDIQSTELTQAARRASNESFMQRASAQQFGGMTDAGYAAQQMWGAQSGARLAQTAKVGAGLLLTGGMMTNIGNDMGGALGGGVIRGIGKTLPWVAAGVAAGAGINEGLNLLHGESLGVTERANRKIGRSVTGVATMRAAGSQAHLGDRLFAGSILRNQDQWNRRAMERFGLSEEDILEETPDFARHYVEGQLNTSGLRKLQDMTSELAETTGGDKDKTRGALRQLYDITGGSPAAGDIAMSLKGINKPFEESAAQLMSIYSGAGVLPGDTASAVALAGQFASGTDRDRALLAEQSQVWGSVGGMLGGYMGSPSAARDLAQKHGLDMMSGRVAQQYMGAATQFGEDMDRVIGYSWDDKQGPVKREVRLSDAIAERAKETSAYQAGIDVRVGEQFIRAGMPTEQAFAQAEQYGITTEMGAQGFTNWAQTSEQYFGQLSQGQLGSLATSYGQQSAFQGNMIGSVSNRMQMGGMDAFGSLSGLGLSDQGMFNLTSAISGDWGARSWFGRENNIPSWQMMDRSGNPMLETSGAGALAFGNAQFGNGNLSAFVPGAGFEAQARSMIGNDQGMIDAFLQEGTQGMGQLHRDRQYGFQMAGIGIGFEKLALQRNFMWGADQGGSWNSPASGSMWAMQDTQQGLRHQAQLAQFASTEERMMLQNQFAISGEDIQSRQMSLTQGMQNWQSGFNRQGAMQRRDWTQQDWQFQDQMKGLQEGWAIEDMDDAIRMSSGRERAKLVEQKERFVTKSNLEGQQTEDERSRQEELWAREDERYSKQIEYNEELQSIEQERFDLQVERREEMFTLQEEEFERSKEEYEEMRQLEEKMQDKQREYQAEQLKLQERSLGVQGAAAAEAKRYADAQEELNLWWKDMVGEAENMSKFDIKADLEAIEALMEETNKSDPETTRLKKEHIEAQNNMKSGQIQSFIDMYSEMDGKSSAANAVAGMLGEFDQDVRTGSYQLKRAFEAAGNINTEGLNAFARAINKASNVSTYRMRELTNFLNIFT